MVNWIILAALILLVIIFFKAKRTQHKIYTILIVLIIIFIYVTGSRIISENNVNIKTLDGIILAGKLYFSWLVNVFNNIKIIAGNAIKLNWMGNSTIKQFLI